VSEPLVAASGSHSASSRLLCSPEDIVPGGVSTAIPECRIGLSHDPPELIQQDHKIRETTPHLPQLAEHLPALSQTLSSSPGSSLSGLASMRSLQERISQNGRRCHSYGSTKYWGPDDEAAQDIQDLSHIVWSMSMEDHLLFAPMEHPKAVLDIGTGTGIWVIDVADQYLEAFVTGIDLSAIQPLWIPRNCDFEVDDFNEELCDWTKPLSFDLIHARELHGTVPDWTTMYRKVYDKLEPGGWFDQAEPSILFLSDLAKFEDEHCFARWNKVMIDAGKRAGMEFEIGDKIADRLTAVGFVNVRVRYEKWPIGVWPKDKHLRKLGAYNRLRLLDGVHGLCARRLMDQMGVRMFKPPLPRGFLPCYSGLRWRLRYFVRS
jgi:hypothetical protein